MRVLGIDPGTAIVGYGIVDFEKNKYQVVDYGCIYTDKDLAPSKRLLIIARELDKLIKRHKPDSIGVETLFFFKNNKTVISVGQARGVIILVCEENERSPYDYTPLQVKQGITGYGKADKKQVQLMVKNILNLETIPKPDDAADALAIAITHINSLNSGLTNNSNTKKSIAIDKNTTKLSAKDFKKLFS